MFRRSAAAATVLGSAALAVAALSGVSASASSDTASSTEGATLHTTTQQASKHKVTTFGLVRAAGVVKAGCLPHAAARVSVESTGPVEIMKVRATGLPRNTGFDFFVLQQPNAPFGLSWYQGDLESDRHGVARGTFVGRFNEETFAVAPGVLPAPVRHTKPIKDASSNPATAPVHQYHLGFWFNSPTDAAKAGCGNVVTPFNGEHNAGTQAMSTRQFGPLDGPLGKIKG